LEARIKPAVSEMQLVAVSEIQLVVVLEMPLVVGLEMQPVVVCLVNSRQPALLDSQAKDLALLLRLALPSLSHLAPLLVECPSHANEITN
jgi:hypothetical protein